MRRHNCSIEGDFVTWGGQADIYKVQLDGQQQILKVYRHEEAQARLRDISEAFAKLSDIPPQLDRARMLDCGSTVYRGRTVPAALFRFVPGKMLFSNNQESDCNLARVEVTDPYRVKLATELIEAVHYLHEHRIIHADLSPTNILVDDSVPELTIIDVDGAGMMTDGKDNWAQPPIVAGQSQVPGFPPPFENAFHVVYPETDDWWLLMLLFYISTSLSPFFFLTDASQASLSELAEILARGKRRDWPPSYDVIMAHSRFRRDIPPEVYAMVSNQARLLGPTNAFFLTLGPGYKNRRMRVPTGYLHRELKASRK
jgi:serine/threonine protein kinase